MKRIPKFETKKAETICIEITSAKKKWCILFPYFLFSLTHLVTGSTCFKSNKGSLIDVLLTNKPKSFYKFHSFVTGLSDCHKLIVSILRTSFQKFSPKFVWEQKKTSVRVISFVIWTLDFFRESYTKTDRIHILKCLKYFQNVWIITRP